MLTPHAAGVDLQSRDDMALSAAEAIVALHRGEWPAEKIVNALIHASANAAPVDRQVAPRSSERKTPPPSVPANSVPGPAAEAEMARHCTGASSVGDAVSRQARAALGLRNNPVGVAA